MMLRVMELLTTAGAGLGLVVLFFSAFGVIDPIVGIRLSLLAIGLAVIPFAAATVESRARARRQIDD